MTRKRRPRWWLELGLALSAVLLFVIATTSYFAGDRDTAVFLIASASVLNLVKITLDIRRERRKGSGDG